MFVDGGVDCKTLLLNTIKGFVINKDSVTARKIILTLDEKAARIRYPGLSKIKLYADQDA